MLWLMLLACTGLTTVPGGELKGDSGGSDSVTGNTAVDGEIQVDPGGLAFGTVSVGQTSSKEIHISRVNAGEPISVEVSLKGDSVFSTTTTTLELEEDAVVTVDFVPGATKSYNGTLKVDAGTSGRIDVELTGEGEKAAENEALSVNPSGVDFGQIEVGQYGSANVLVENIGTQDVLISDIRYSDSSLSFGGGSITLPQVISPGKNKALVINFSPTQQKVYNGTVTLISDDPVNPRLEISTSGEGVHSCSICSPILTVDTGGSDPYGADFGVITAFGNSDTKTFTLINDGDQDLDVRSMTVTNDFLASCGTFSVKGWAGSKTLTPGKSFSVDVTWKVTGSCLDVDQSSLNMNILEINTNDPGANPYTIKLTGTAI